MLQKIMNVSKVSAMSSPATSGDREKVVSKLPGWLRQDLKIRAAQHGIEIQAAVEQGITDWCNLASTPATIDTAGAESFSTFLPDGQWETFRSVATDRSVSLIQGLAQAVQLWLDANPAPHIARPTITRRMVVCNQKGGVGKTAITAGTGEALAEDPNTLHPVRVAKALTKALRASATRADESEPAGDDPLDIENLPGPGLRVLLVDFDPQCHLTNQLGANPLPMNGDSLTNHMAGDPKETSATSSSPSTTKTSAAASTFCPPATTHSCLMCASPRCGPAKPPWNGPSLRSKPTTTSSSSTARPASASAWTPPPTTDVAATAKSRDSQAP